MRIRVTSPFRDRYDHSRTFIAGEVADFEEWRAKDIIARGLGVSADVPPKRKRKAETDR